MALDADIKDPRISNAASVLPDKAVNSVPYIDFRMLTAALAHMGEMYFGSEVGTGAALEVTGLPFDPAAVLAINVTDPTLGVHLPSMAAASMLKLTDAPALTVPVADGITLGAKGERKFTIGADADLNVAAEVIHYVAIGTRGLAGSE